jgi:RNA polymerase sigma-70 factor (ECF subfamily)
MQHIEVRKSSATDDQKSLAMLYDEHAAVVLGFLEKLADDKDKAEELLQAVFLALPGQLHEFDPQKGRFVVWLLRLARTIAGQGQKSAGFKTNGNYASTNAPIHDEASNVGSTDINPSRPLTTGADTSVVELLYVKGYNFAQAAAFLGVDERAVQVMVRTELKKYRR